MSTWITHSSASLNEVELSSLYKMYSETYTAAGEELWFKSSQDMLRYPCTIIANVNGNGKLISFIMYQLWSKVNKISLFGHDGTPEGKKNVMDRIAQQLVTPGFVLEAAGAVSWVLRSRYNLAPTTDRNKIKRIFNIEDDSLLEVTPNYNMNDRAAFVYTRLSKDLTSGQIYIMKESLFGISCDKDMRWDGEDCSRLCISYGINDI